jgi:hypothetical protein
VSPLEAAERLASGTDRFHRNLDADEFVSAALSGGVRPTMAPEDELALWEVFGELCKELGPKCRFNKDGICNNAEKRRRNAMFGILRLVCLRSEDERIRAAFQRHYGQVSLQWMMTVCGTDAPPFYYEWAFDAIRDVSGKTWGPKALAYVQRSWAHMEAFQRLAPEKFNQLAVKRVMES